MAVFGAETKILTFDGKKLASEIKPDDVVWTHMGRWRPVLKTFYFSDIRPTVYYVAIADGNYYGLVRFSKWSKILTGRGWIYARTLGRHLWKCKRLGFRLVRVGKSNWVCRCDRFLSRRAFNPQVAYDFIVEEDNSYVANDFIFRRDYKVTKYGLFR